MENSKKEPATIENPPLKNTGTDKKDLCETAKELQKTSEDQLKKIDEMTVAEAVKSPEILQRIFDNFLVQDKIDEISKIELPAYKTPNLVAAINQVMREVKNIEKNSTVGQGDFAFNAVSDKDVKFQVGQAMERAGLAVIPISVEPLATIDRYEDQWKKRKKDVFTEVKTKYLLMHESGEKIEFAGYGHGTDPSDKSAGKATTYALKYALLYLFMIPTGKIDDADKTQPQKEGDQIPTKTQQTLNDAQFKKALKAIEDCRYTKEELQNDYKLSEDQEKQLPK